MSAYGALRRRLTADAGVAAIAGSRVFPMAAPQGAAYPLITYQRISQDALVTHEGPAEMRKNRYQVTAVAKSYTDAQRLANAIDNAIAGVWQDAEEGHVVATPITRLDVTDEETGAYRVPADYYIWATDAVPA